MVRAPEFVSKLRDQELERGTLIKASMHHGLCGNIWFRAFSKNREEAAFSVR
jgi:hypothetical protein